jgi:hypothetical protein
MSSRTALSDWGRYTGKWALAGFAVPAFWFTFWKLWGAQLFRSLPKVAWFLQMGQFATWPTSDLGLVPYSLFGNRFLFMAALVVLNIALYATVGSALWLGLRFRGEFGTPAPRPSQPT